jgi:hypothetical protein
MRACNCEQAQELRKRIQFLEDAARKLESERDQLAVENKAYREAYERATARIHLLMERRQRPSDCCDDFPECNHNRGS